MNFNYMKVFLFALAGLIHISLFSQTWVQKASLPISNGLLAPAFFTINGKLYVGAGYAVSATSNAFYEYNPSTNAWTQVASMPGALYNTACFALNGKGYVATGGISNSVYKYDPVANAWQTMNPFPGSARSGPVGFSFHGKGYLFAGFLGGSTNVNDMWEYNDTTDTWTQKASAPGPGRNNPIFLVVNNQAFVGLGSDPSANPTYTDMYRFDPVANTYTQVASIPVGRTACANFSVGSYGYVGVGEDNNSSCLDDFWKYDPVANTWTQINNFGGAARGWVFNATVGGLPYVGCGSGYNGSFGPFYIDNWTWASCNLTINLGNDTTLCSPATITLKDTFTNARSLWSTGDTTSSITVSTSGTYWLQVTQGTCTGSDTINISFVSPPASFSLGNDTTYCGPFTRTLSSGTVNTLWSTGVTDSAITISIPGTYWALDSSACGSIRESIVISQNPLPVVNLGNDTDLCTGNTLTINATTPNATYSWQNGTTVPTFTVTTSGTYWVAVTVNGCSTSDSIVVGYINPLTFNIGNDTTYCGSFSRTLTAGIAHTVWSNGYTALSITVNAPGTYWGGIIACGDTLSDSITITEKPLPVVNIGDDTTLCTGSTLTLNATTGSASYLWQNGSTGPTFTVSNAGIYWVDVTVNGCTKPDSIDISYASPLAISLGSDTSICEDSILILNVFEPLAHYLWSNGDTTAFITANQSGTYTVTVSNACGSATASENITVKQCVCKVAIPNAFSPNNDGKNDFFGVLTQCPVQDFELDIYNRWGQKVFSANDPATKWDGTYRGMPQPISVFVYMVRYRDPYTGENHNQAGNVTLLR
jgi:gliding motility-associated-like protein